LLETARAIEAGARPLASARPDLPRSLLAAVDRALDVDPSRRPAAAVLAQTLRAVPRKRRRTRGRELAPPIALVRAAPALLAALFAGWTAWAIPFYPSGWFVGLTVLAGAITLVRPRAGLAFALAVPILPLGNFALGAAVLYTVLALLLLALFWREPAGGLLLTLGPLLAPISAVGFVPLLATTVRSTPRRAIQAGAAVLSAGLVAGIRHAPLPFDGRAVPGGLGLAASTSATATASVLWHAFLSRPSLVVETFVFGAAAALFPYARARGLWAIGGLGSAMLAAALLPVPTVAAIPLVVAVWVTCAILATCS
jgi:hypothetical protein